MAFSKAQRAARYRAAHPDRVEAYETSERGREVGRLATRRFRAKHPKPKKELPPPIAVAPEHEANLRRRADHMNKWKAGNEGFAVCTDYPPPPADSKCQRCRAHTKLHLDHDHDTGVFRGWLCLNCNMGLGKFGDSREGLLTAVAYFDGELPWQAHPFPGINGTLGFGA